MFIQSSHLISGGLAAGQTWNMHVRRVYCNILFYFFLCYLTEKRKTPFHNCLISKHYHVLTQVEQRCFIFLDPDSNYL